MAAHNEAILNRWARQGRQQGWGTYLAALLEAFEPLAPAGAVLLQGGGRLFVPWVDEESIQALTWLLENREQRARFLQALTPVSGDPVP